MVGGDAFNKFTVEAVPGMMVRRAQTIERSARSWPNRMPPEPRHGLPNLKVVLDGANLFHSGELPRMREILAEACELLGMDTVVAACQGLES